MCVSRRVGAREVSTDCAARRANRSAHIGSGWVRLDAQVRYGDHNCIDRRRTRRAASVTRMDNAGNLKLNFLGPGPAGRLTAVFRVHGTTLKFNIPPCHRLHTSSRNMFHNRHSHCRTGCGCKSVTRARSYRGCEFACQAWGPGECERCETAVLGHIGHAVDQPLVGSIAVRTTNAQIIYTGGTSSFVSRGGSIPRSGPPDQCHTTGCNVCV